MAMTLVAECKTANTVSLEVKNCIMEEFIG